MVANISVPGPAHHPLVFTVSGTSAANYATAFQAAIDKAIQSNTFNMVVNPLGKGPAAVAGGTTLNEFVPTGPSSYTLSTGGQYSIVDNGSATTLNGSTAGGDTVLAGGAATYIANGGHDVVTFYDGSNTYVGGTATGDTITGGTGVDFITTGTGSDTVFSGAGSTQITLSGTDLAYLGDGTAAVTANGLSDTVVAATFGQTIIDGSAGNLTVVIMDNPSSAGAAGDAIYAGASTVSVFDSVGGNSIYGAAGSLTFVGGAGVFSDSITAGSGTTNVFASAGNTLAFTSTSTSGALYAIGGAGNESLGGANTASNFAFFGSTDTALATSTTVVGGSGNDFFSTGAGTESLTGGSGTDLFALNTLTGGAGAHITISNFTAADYITITGETAAQAAATVAAGTVNNNSLTITLSDHTTVTFSGVTSLPPGHII